MPTPFLFFAAFPARKPAQIAVSNLMFFRCGGPYLSANSEVFLAGSLESLGDSAR
jgi:hypothetical protein